MKYLKTFNENYSNEIEVVFTHENNPNLKFSVFKNKNGRITKIENERGIRFPYKVGELYTRGIEIWASNNSFKIDGKYMGPDKKIFGIKTSDIPKGHEWRTIYKNKFKD